MPRYDQEPRYHQYMNFVPVEDGMVKIGIKVPEYMSEALHDDDPEAWQAYLRLLDECRIKSTESDMPDMYPFS
jgi:hypothetical protein